jgi:hypothetical protein
MTYSELVTKIRDYTEVDSNVLTSTIINGFIENAEFRILRDVDSDNNRKYDTSTFVVSQKFLNTPANLLIITSAEVINAGVRLFMEPRDMTFIDEYNSTGVTGVPKYYANWNENTIEFAPIPDQTYTIQLSYILKPVGLSATNTTTYLSQQFPNGLLYACLVEAYGFLKGPTDMLQYYENRYKQATDGFALEQMGRRRRDEYHDGVIRLNVKQSK